MDATGTVVNGYTYDVYGKETSSTGSQANEFDFAGQESHPGRCWCLRPRGVWSPLSQRLVSTS